MELQTHEFYLINGWDTHTMLLVFVVDGLASLEAVGDVCILLMCARKMCVWFVQLHRL